MKSKRFFILQRRQLWVSPTEIHSRRLRPISEAPGISLRPVDKILRLSGLLLPPAIRLTGTRKSFPMTKVSPLQGSHPYDVSKSCADLIATSYHNTYGLPVAITRCGNLFGGGDLNFNRIIPGTIRSIVHEEKPIIRSDGTLKRDYVYVKDAVDAYLVLAEALDDISLHGNAFNFGTARPLVCSGNHQQDTPIDEP